MRRFLLLVSVIVFVDAMLFGILAPLVPGYAEEFGLSKGGIGLLVGAFGAGALIGGIPGGLAAARYGPKRAVMLGLGLLALEFERAERLLVRVIVWADKAKDRAQRATVKEKVAAGVLVALLIGAFVAAAILYDIPLLPV